MPFNKLNHSVLGEIRPRFKLVSELFIDKIKKLIEVELEKNRSVFGSVKMGCVVLKIPLKDQYYWSPELQIHLEKSEVDNKTILRCLLGPKQTVWALFLFVYITIAVLTLFIGMYGLVQWQLGTFSSTIYVIPIGVLILPSIYTFSKLGQKTGREQMLHLVSYLYHLMDQGGGAVTRVEE